MSEQLLFLRASAAPLNMRCPGSARPAKLPIRDDSEPARLGTAAHQLLAALAETGDPPWSDVAEVAKHFDVHETELRVLLAQGSKLWDQVKDSFVDALSEVELSTELLLHDADLSGHVDLLSVSGNAARAADWKTGRKDSDYSAQMRAYAALILLENSELDEATVTVLWVREGEIENYTMTRAQLGEWLAEYVTRVVEWDGTYYPGSHCAYCPRSHECEAANAHTRRDVSAIADRSLVARAECELATMAPEEILSLQDKAASVAKLAKRALDAVKAHVAEHGDIIADGHRLTIEQRERKDLDTLKAWPVLESSGFGDEEFQQVVSLSLSKVNSVMAKQAGRGKGAAAVRELRAKLDEANAVRITPSQILTRKRV